MALTASKTASCTIALQRAWKNGVVGAAVTVACMITFQSVTVSARAADGVAAASAIASIKAAHRKKFRRLIGLHLSLGLRDKERAPVPARRPSAEAVPGRRGACLAV